MSSTAAQCRAASIDVAPGCISSTRRRRALLLAATCLAYTNNVNAADAPSKSAEEIVVTGNAVTADNNLPAASESVTADEIAKQINVLTPEDTLKYLPDVLIRQRHPGDTQAPVTTRTSGVGSSARSLIYVDGVLISSLIGNNNTSASPKWGLVSPDAIERVDVMYGPFAAAYAGNSIGTVVAFTTRMPTAFEASADAQGALQWFSKYGDDRTYGTYRFAGELGDRIDDLAFRISYNHLDAHAQPLTYATAAIPPAPSTTGTPVTGAYVDVNRTGAPIAVLGSTAIEHQVQDNVSGRATYDISPTVTAAYTFGLFVNTDDAVDNTYLRDANGQPIYAGALNIGGRNYSIAAAAFSNSVYDLNEVELAQGLSVSSHTGGAFDFDVAASWFDYVKSHQRVPTGVLPGAYTGGAGATSNLDNTGWYTLDANGAWRPADTNTLTFGAHRDFFHIDNPKYALADWLNGAPGALQTASDGKTETDALWAQDMWKILPGIQATLGGRYERWHAYDGVNYSAAPALHTVQPTLSADAFSPKFVLAYAAAPAWTLKGSVGLAYRFPTVTELYQAVTTGAVLSVPNPDLKPERSLSSEVSLEHVWTGGDARISVFGERIDNALVSQTSPLPAGSTTLASYVQNIDRTRATGVEVVAREGDILVRGLELSGWITYVDAKTAKDSAYAAAVGKDLPQLPRLRAAAVATYTAVPDTAITIAARYSDKAFGAIDNTDDYANTYQGFAAYFVVDAHVRYQVNPHLAADVGVNNLNDRSYFLYHPFPQRTLVADVKYTY